MASIKQHRCGGTLLEVLVSLIIVTLVGTSMVEVATQKRRALAEDQRSKSASVWAMMWRTAQISGEDWTKGDAGKFPGHEEIQWRLELAAAIPVQGSVQTDAYWRRLAIYPSPSEPDQRASFLFRIDGPPSDKKKEASE